MWIRIREQVAADKAGKAARLPRHRAARRSCEVARDAVFPRSQGRGIGRGCLEVMGRLVVYDEQRLAILGVSTVKQRPESAEAERQHKQTRRRAQPWYRHAQGTSHPARVSAPTLTSQGAQACRPGEPAAPFSPVGHSMHTLETRRMSFP